MGPLNNIKDAQKLMGCLASLGRFISRLGERGLPLYKLLKKSDRFEWTDEAHQALEGLKKLLTEPPVLVPPREREPLLYIAATTQVVSAVIVVEREEEGHALRVQHPVYYISEVLTESRTRYLQVQKMVYAVLIVNRKLRHYFDSHHITVVNDNGLGEVIHNREATGKIAKWAMELMGQDISYAPRTAIKSQVLADFVAEWTETQLPPAPVDLEFWTLHFDGAQNRTGAGVGVVFISPLGVQLKYAIRLHFPASNNMAEYEALIAGLRIARELGICRVEARGDSQLVVDQVNGDAKCHNPQMAVYCEAVRRAQEKFHGLGFVHLRREFNGAADELAKLAASREAVPVGVFANDQHRPSVKFDGELGEGTEPRPNPEGTEPRPDPEAPAGQDHGSATLVAAITRASAAAPDPPLQDADPTIEPNKEWGFEDGRPPRPRSTGRLEGTIPRVAKPGNTP
jgi:ribonuclease HI